MLDAKLQAWVHILNEVWDGGLNYGYHIVTFKIPHDEDFYGDPYFVKMLLTNPTTQKHGEILSPKEGKETKPGRFRERYSKGVFVLKCPQFEHQLQTTFAVCSLTANYVCSSANYVCSSANYVCSVYFLTQLRK